MEETGTHRAEWDATRLLLKYRDLLLDYLGSPGEHDRDAVLDFGYDVVRQQWGSIQLVGLHHAVLLNLFTGAQVCRETIALAGELLQEVIGKCAIFRELASTVEVYD